jgi:hypothetical protein
MSSWRELTARARFRNAGPWVVIDASLHPADERLFARETRKFTAHRYLVRLAGTRKGRRTAERWSGSDSGLSEVALADDLPQAEAVWVPRAPGLPLLLEVECRIELWSGVEDVRETVVTLRGEMSLTPPFAGSLDLPLFEVPGPLPQVAFKDPIVKSVEARPGPNLMAPEEAESAGEAPIPEVGVMFSHLPAGALFRTYHLAQPDGVLQLADMPMWLGDEVTYTPGPGGRMAVAWGEREPSLQLSIFSPPDWAHAFHVPPAETRKNPPLEGAFDPSGRYFAYPAVTDTVAVVDVEERRVVWEQRLPGVRLKRAALHVDGEAVYVVSAGRLVRLSLESGEVVGTVEIPTPPHEKIRLAFHSEPQRLAWAAPLHEEVGLIVWHDLEHVGGQRLVADDLSNARLAVLPDGRIVLKGRERLWLVSPEDGRVRYLSEAPPTTARLIVTRAPTGYRVWTRSLRDPWFIEFD